MPVAGEISCVRRSEGIRRLSLDLDLGTSFFMLKSRSRVSRISGRASSAGEAPA